MNYDASNFVVFGILRKSNFIKEIKLILYLV
jgi:hypothetical protein